jgi:hypothetical protein
MNKYFKNVGLKGHKIVSQPGASTCLGLVLNGGDVIAWLEG